MTAIDANNIILKLGYILSDFKTLQEDEIKYQFRGFQSIQMDVCKSNLYILEKMPGNNRKFYMLDLAGGRMNIKAWATL